MWSFCSLIIQWKTNSNSFCSVLRRYVPCSKHFGKTCASSASTRDSTHTGYKGYGGHEKLWISGRCWECVQLDHEDTQRNSCGAQIDDPHYGKIKGDLRVTLQRLSASRMHWYLRFPVWTCFKNNFPFFLFQTLSLDESDLSTLQFLKETLDLPEPSPLQPLSDKFKLVCTFFFLLIR